MNEVENHCHKDRWHESNYPLICYTRKFTPLSFGIHVELTCYLLLISSFFHVSNTSNSCCLRYLASLLLTLTVKIHYFHSLSSLPLLPSKSELTCYYLPFLSECSLPKIRACISSCMLVIHVSHSHFSSIALSCPFHSPGPLSHFFILPQNTTVAYIRINYFFYSVISVSFIISFFWVIEM